MKKLAKGQSLKLKNYNQVFKSMAALTAALLATKKDDAQVIYHDINPDVTILLNDTFGIDMNNDGILDLRLANISSAVFGQSVMFYDRSSHVYNAVSQSGSLIPLNNGDDINLNLHWDHSPLLDEVGFLNNGLWKNVTNKYAGIKMKVGGSNHYGWVRMDVTTNPLKIVVKDYAYNFTPEQHIISSVEDVNSGLVPTIYSNEGILYIQLPQEEVDAKATIYNLLGEKVYEKKVSIGKNEMNLNLLPKGIYLMHVDGDKINYSMKIQLN